MLLKISTFSCKLVRMRTNFDTFHFMFGVMFRSDRNTRQTISLGMLWKEFLLQQIQPYIHLTQLTQLATHIHFLSYHLILH